MTYQINVKWEHSEITKYLVTGGAGFIGSNIVAALVEKGYYVRVLDNFHSGSRDNLSAFEGKIDLIEGDVRSIEDCRRACSDIEVIFHEAAMCLSESIVDPLISHEVNMDGTCNILEAARAAKCHRVIYASSASAYGNAPVLPNYEDQVPAPLNPYSAHKVAGELYCRAYYECFGLETISLRYNNVFGPNQEAYRFYPAAIPAFIARMLANQPPIVQGDGEQTRDFTYIDNIVHANILCAAVAKTMGQVINIGSGEQVSLNHLIAKINNYLGKDIKPEYAPTKRPAKRVDVHDRLADISLAKEIIGFEPFISFDKGLQMMIDWCASKLADKSSGS